VSIGYHCIKERRFLKVGIIRSVRYNTALPSACLDREIGSVGVNNVVKFGCSER
jgi:hypothetical protein